MADRKTIDTWEIHTNYGQGWEHETTELTLADARSQKRLYNENCDADIRIVYRRIRKDSLSSEELEKILMEQRDRKTANYLERQKKRAAKAR